MCMHRTPGSCMFFPHGWCYQHVVRIDTEIFTFSHHSPMCFWAEWTWQLACLMWVGGAARALEKGSRSHNCWQTCLKEDKWKKSTYNSSTYTCIIHCTTCTYLCVGGFLTRRTLGTVIETSYIIMYIFLIMRTCTKWLTLNAWLSWWWSNQFHTICV